MFKLILLAIFILIVIGFVKLGKFLFKVADTMEVDEKKGDIQHNAELAGDVDEYVEQNAEAIEVASSDSVDTFLEN